ncbi:transposase-like protein [Agromyces terreus]|uniref:Transposase-like protein n=1 Tax=Agromyces terreus TaxID=424795 RepID=A0A9X2GZ73_9MICO|nr:transposase-like protein [Agromyces terreus]
MARPSKYPREVRERAVRMVVEVRPDYPSEYQAMTAVAGMLGIGSPETVRTWMRRQQVNAGVRPGLTTDAQAELKGTAEGLGDSLTCPTVWLPFSVWRSGVGWMVGPSIVRIRSG